MGAECFPGLNLFSLFHHPALSIAVHLAGQGRQAASAQGPSRCVDDAGGMAGPGGSQGSLRGRQTPGSTSGTVCLEGQAGAGDVRSRGTAASGSSRDPEGLAGGQGRRPPGLLCLLGFPRRGAIHDGFPQRLDYAPVCLAREGTATHYHLYLLYTNEYNSV